MKFNKKINDYSLWTALITPMFENGSVDYDSLKSLLKEQDEAKNGILILGSTGESLNLDMHEQKRILDFTLSQKLNSPIMCGVGGINLEQTRSWVSYLNTLEIDCYLLVTPLYAKPGMVGQLNWFKTLMLESNKPVCLYNVPSRTGISLNYETVKKLADHPKLWAIKEASGSIEDFSKYVKAAPKAKIFSGDDSLTFDFVKVGCSGLISVAANVWPKATNLYTKKCIDQTLTDIKMWQECADSLFLASNPIPAKVLIKKLGRISTSTLRAPLTDQDLESSSPLMESNTKINNWFNKNK